MTFDKELLVDKVYKTDKRVGNFAKGESDKADVFVDLLLLVLYYPCVVFKY